jgi:hypothetical protein
MISNSPVRLLQALLLAFAVTALAAPARAQQPSANAIAMAKEIITLKGSAAGYNVVGTGVIEQAKAVLLQTNPTLGKDLNEVAAKVRTDFAARLAEPLDDAAKLYAGAFTEPELKDILAFYKSPAGKKVIDQEGKIFETSMTNLDAWAGKFSEEVLSRMRVEMRKRGHEL